MNTNNLNVQNVPVNGIAIPSIGFGTYGMGGANGMGAERLVRLISRAISAGFRHIDTAQIYGNEAEVGAAIQQSGIGRQNMFVTTKVWVANYPNERFQSSVDDSLRRFQTDYIDLLLLHWPSEGVPLSQQLESLNQLVKVGKVRHIGISNFNQSLAEEAVRLSEIPLVTNQFEFHPYLNQTKILATTERLGMVATAYCAMALGKVFSDPRLKSIAERYDKGVSQIVLRWVIQQGAVALSRTTNESRLAENLAIFDFELEEADMQAIGRLAIPNSRIVNPPGLAPDWD